MENADFDSVSWANDVSESNPAAAAAVESGGNDHRAGGGGGSSSNGKQQTHAVTPQAGINADPMDLAGVGQGRLDCTVTSPQKENEGTKDVFVSYLVNTHVRPRDTHTHTHTHTRTDIQE